MKYLIFETDLLGHRLEYLHHYYMGAIQRANNDYYFYVPESFVELKSKYEWPVSSNVKFIFISNREEKRFLHKKPLSYCFNISRVLNRTVRRVKPDCVILTTLITYIPFITIMLPKNVKVRGIIYNIYYYDLATLSRLRLLYERFRHFCISNSHIVDTAFVLNDNKACALLNKDYKTDKYHYLVDPVPSVEMTSVRDLREELLIPSSAIVYLHFGAMDRRKGTIDLLKAISMMTAEEKNEKVFIFAGKVLDEIKGEFYELYNHISSNSRVILYDQFCAYELLYSLCKTSSVIVAPYRMTSNSSGVIGYAALFKKPVIGPESGLIGQIIKDNSLGKCIKETTPLVIKDALLNIPRYFENDYASTHSVEAFTNQILSD